MCIRDSRITAPVDGRVGLKQVDVGNQISSGDTTGIVVITQTHPIALVFTLPESDIATVVQAHNAGKPLVEMCIRDRLPCVYLLMCVLYINPTLNRHYITIVIFLSN